MLFLCGSEYIHQVEENELKAFVNVNRPGRIFHLTDLKSGEVMDYTIDHLEDERGFYLCENPLDYLQPHDDTNSLGIHPSSQEDKGTDQKIGLQSQGSPEQEETNITPGKRRDDNEKMFEPSKFRKTEKNGEQSEVDQKAGKTPAHRPCDKDEEALQRFKEKCNGENMVIQN